MTTPQTQPTPEQWADTLEKLARDKALPSLWPEDCLAIAAHLRAQAAALASKEAECERLRVAAREMLALQDGPQDAAYRELLPIVLRNLRAALTPTQEAQE